ncbi:MAG: hypothetical protein K2K99_05390 [Muribaculaceae bacterium]|nr:hypothetical protein [Muribaculaceae bacterium]
MIAVEIKSNAEKSTAGLETFRKLFKPKTSFIVGDGGINAADFLSMELKTLL